MDDIDVFWESCKISMRVERGVRLAELVFLAAACSEILLVVAAIGALIHV